MKKGSGLLFFQFRDYEVAFWCKGAVVLVQAQLNEILSVILCGVRWNFKRYMS